MSDYHYDDDAFEGFLDDVRLAWTAEAHGQDQQSLRAALDALDSGIGSVLTRVRGMHAHGALGGAVEGGSSQDVHTAASSTMEAFHDAIGAFADDARDLARSVVRNDATAARAIPEGPR